MRTLRRIGWGAAIVLAVVCSAGILLAQSVQTDTAQPAGKWNDVSLADYRTHLRELVALTQECAKGRDLKSCDPTRVGPDDEIPWGGQKRLVRYGWLRVLFAQAWEPDETAKAQSDSVTKDDSEEKADEEEKSDVRTTSQLLADAQARLAADLAQSDAAPGAGQQYQKERAVLQQVLAGNEFRNLKQPDGKESALEKLNNWLNKLFEGLGKLHVRSAWIGRLIIWGFIVLVGVGLAWTLLQWERRWRVRLVLENDGPAPTAASARDWQLWLKDARDAAARRQWREAIHFLYWAAISRLESKRLWPADRARTPREYLALVASDDPRKTGLGALTREFEWTWYGGRPAGEGEYRHAEELATGLFEGGGATAAGSRGVAQ